MTDPDAPPPIAPSPPEYDPGGAPDEAPMQTPPIDPNDDRPYDADLGFTPVTSD